jgi:hypothetical protein
MDALNRLLERLRGSLDGDRVVKKEISFCIKEIAGFEVLPEDISFQGDALRIKASPAKRNELKLNEIKILEAVRAQTKLNLKRLVY